MADLIYQGQTYIDTATPVSYGINVPRSTPTNFQFLNNYVSSINVQGYMIQAGDEGISATNGNLNGEIIKGNKFDWKGDFAGLGTAMTITHGVFTGCNIDVDIKHNYLSRVPMGIIRKSASNMVNTKGGVSYNIVKTFNVGGVVKGMSNVNWYNNTFYQDRPTYSSTDPTAGTWRGAIDIYTNTDVTPNSAATGTKIKNNIFYSKYKTLMVNVMDAASLSGFECDYNVYWVEEGDHTPVFNAGGTSKTWDQWRAMGYDAHSVVMNPNFIDLVNFVPAARLNYGTNLGTEFNTGLSTTATWVAGTAPATTVQNGTWQVGARVYASADPLPVNLLIENQNIVNSDPEWDGYNVPHSVKTNLTFRNNAITSVNTSMYLLQAGDDYAAPTINNLDGAQIYGNKLVWNGVQTGSIITHGLFVGYNINQTIKWNYLQNIPYNIIFKSGGTANPNMSITSGGASYNIVKGGRFAGRAKGINGVRFYNNTFYGDAGSWYILLINANSDGAPTYPGQPSINGKVKNNIFYTTTKTPSISIDAGSRTGFECDYNLYWCEAGDHNPVFLVDGVSKTWAEWRALGHDAHSIVVNPNFNNTTDFVPTARLNYGVDLGTEYNAGLSTTAVWTVGTTPATTVQNGTWQVGARVYAASTAVAPTVPTTTAASSITQTTAVSGGTITSDGGSPITAKGVCWDQSGGPALDNPHTNDGTGTGAFTSNITGLAANTLYYVRSYATNAVGTGYGPRIQFTTASVVVAPTVTTTAITTITTTGAVGGGNATSDGGSAILERGVCWNTTTNPTTANNKQASGTGTGVFTSAITGLTQGTTYYVRAYARNAIGTSYGANVSFTTAAIVPVAPYYVSTTGSDATGDGTITKPWFTLNKAWSYVKAGETIYLRGGTYQINEEQHLYSKSGTSTNPIRILAYQNEKPFISPSTSFAGYVGVEIENVNYLHIKGLEVANFIQRTPTEWYNGLTAYNINNCILELINVHHNGFGFSIGGISTGNLVLNSDFHHNYDNITAFPPPYNDLTPYGNADGLTIRVADPSSVNTVRGCRMWNNSDDGFDGWYNSGLLVFEDCWSFNNGYREDGVTEGGDGNGFKMGPLVASPWTGFETEHKRTMKNCIAFNNRMNGFDQNATLAVMYFYNCAAFGNGNHGFLMNNDATIQMIARNNISYKNVKGAAYFTAISTVDHNTFTAANGVNPAYSVTDADFISINAAGMDGARQADGSLPNLNFLKLALGSDLINGGIDVGIPYKGTAPDLGPFESDYAAPVLPTVTTTAASSITTTTAITGGNVTADGGATVSERGVCWSTSTNPTTANSKLIIGSGTGTFSGTITGLIQNTTYYVRAYAINSAGTNYGSSITFKTAAIIPVAPYFVSTTGSDVTGEGTITKPWYTLEKAWSYVKAGETIYMRGGTYYYYEQQILTGKHGTSGNTIKVLAYNGERPIISKGEPYAPPSWPTEAIVVTGNYLYFKGIDVSGFPQGTDGLFGGGMRAYGCNYSTFELLDIHHNGGGFQLTNCNQCYVINSDFHHNQDPYTGTGSSTSTAGAYGNADGMGVDGTNPDAINYVRGCRFWYNTDDGIDGWAEEGTIVIENCWSFWNGFIPDTWNKGGDGSGFKLGKTDAIVPTLVKRKLYNNVSFQNKKWGFLDNGIKCNVELYNNTAFENGYKNLDTWAGGFHFNLAPVAPYYIKNNISYKNIGANATIGDVTNVDHNTWDLPVTVTDADFLSIDVTGVTGARQSDGSLPVLNFMKLAAGSDLINKGVNVGLPYIGTAPDLGAYESNFSPILPNITTKTMTDVTKNTASTGGIVTADGGSPITAKGVCWNTSPIPTLANSHTDEGPGAGEFISNLTGLTPNTTYYVRAYATNDVGTSYGAEMVFTTLKELFLATVTTTAISSITENSGVGGGNVTFDGNTAIIDRGVCWNTTGNPTTADPKTSDGTTTGAFTSNLTTLLPDTTYYVKAYVINSVGTSYGEQVTFVTLKHLELPVVTTAIVTDITENTAVSGGNVTFDGNTTVTGRGICWNTSGNPSVDDNVVYSGSGLGTFTSSLASLAPNTTYYVRAFAVNSVGPAYGEQLIFTTLKHLELPVVVTAIVTNITKDAATSGGNVTFDGYDNVIARGVVWDTSPDPTIGSNKTVDGNGTGVFSSSISGLTPNTDYFVKAYAENSVGIGYGQEESFKTIVDVSDNGLKIYPNPVPKTTTEFRIEVTVPNFDSTRVYIYDLVGRLIYTEKMNCLLVNYIEGHTRNEAIIPKRKFTPGTYIVQVTNKKGTVVVGKVIIL